MRVVLVGADRIGNDALRARPGGVRAFASAPTRIRLATRIRTQSAKTPAPRAGAARLERMKSMGGP